jgi:DNA-binding CsgD family transcriptional regulator
MLDIDNPFADYGNIVSGSRFIGRLDHIQEIEARVIRPPGGNLAIIGQRRIGKSSLADHAIMARREELLGQRILPVDLSVGIYDSSQQFFCDLVNLCFRNLDHLDWVNRSIREAAAEVRARDVERFNFSEIKAFFSDTSAAGIRIILVLDEFDKTANFFAGDTSFFDRLRDLSYRGQATLVTISRDPVAVIEQKAHITSTLVGTIHSQYLGVFVESEINDHFDRLRKLGIHLTGDHKRRIVNWCGGQPYMHDKLAFELVELYRQDGKIHLDEAFHRAEFTFLHELEVITNHLHDRGLLNLLMEALFAVPPNMKSAGLKELESYGLIRNTGSGYIAFSDTFQEYLRQRLPTMLEDLSNAEQRVLFCLSNDMQNKEIANQLNLSENTIKSHLNSIFRKLKVNTRQEAVRRARERGVVP